MALGIVFQRQRVKSPVRRAHRRDAFRGNAVAGNIEESNPLQVTPQGLHHGIAADEPPAGQAGEVEDRNLVEVLALNSSHFLFDLEGLKKSI